MKILLTTAMAAAMLAAPTTLATPAFAQHHSDYRWDGDNNRNWDPSQHYHPSSHGERTLGRDDHVYRGRDGRTYCRRSDGTTGLVIGAVGGGVIGNVLGGGTLGTLLGAGGGALLGRSVDRGNVKCR